MRLGCSGTFNAQLLSRILSARRLRSGATMSAETPVRETGVSFVDKRRLLPVYSTWAGAVTIAEQLRALGATAEGFRGRAYLVGTRFDSVFAQEGIER